jgi:hypothetical protein
VYTSLQGIVSRKSSNARLTVEETFPDLKEVDLQGFPNDEISKSEIRNIIFPLRNFENMDEDDDNRVTCSSSTIDMVFVYGANEICNEECVG